ncbi:MAG: hypothetical protein ACTSWL_08220 [Promethearchaeota archaeon]
MLQTYKQNQKQINRKRKKKQKKIRKGYHKNGMPFWGDKILNITLKFIFGVIIFWVLYYPLYNSEMEVFSRISFIMLYSIISSLGAILIAFIIIVAINNKFKYPRKGISDLNSMPDLISVLGELIAIALNAVVQSAGLLWMINSQIGSSWYVFLGIYCALKIITRILAIFISLVISKNILLTVGFLLTFGAILAISIIQIQKVVLNIGQ